LLNFFSFRPLINVFPAINIFIQTCNFSCTAVKHQILNITRIVTK
jgi:hypothetical protein